MKATPILLQRILLLIALTLSSFNTAWAFELIQLKQQKPYVLEVRYGTQENLPTSTEPSAEFLANAESLDIRVAPTDSNQIASGPFTFGFALAPGQKAETYAVRFQGAYQLQDSGKSFEGASLVRLNEWVLIAETSMTVLTPNGEKRQIFSVAMRLRAD